MLFSNFNRGKKINSQIHVPMSIRVLLVNSHQIVLWGLEMLINGEAPRMEVVGKATNGPDATHIAREKKPDILLLDLFLGMEKAPNLIPSLLREGQFHIIIFTAFDDQAAIEEALLNGARGVVFKEEPTQNILKAIEKVHAGELWLDRSTTGRIFINFIREGQKPTDSITKKNGCADQKRARYCHGFRKPGGRFKQENSAKAMH